MFGIVFTQLERGKKEGKETSIVITHKEKFGVRPLNPAKKGEGSLPFVNKLEWEKKKQNLMETKKENGANTPARKGRN